MTRSEWTLAQETAIHAAEKAGRLARERFSGELNIQHKGSKGDFVTDVDMQADRLIVGLIRDTFPSHCIYSEEGGKNGAASDWVWHVDPLDGTNNYAIGLPLYGVSISLSYQGTTVVGVVHDSALQHTYTAVRGEGAWLGDRCLEARPQGELAKSTISWIQGHAVGKTDEAASKLRHHLERRLKRVVRLWAPTLTWTALARGDLHGVVLYNSESEDLYAGLLLAEEAGVKITDFFGQPLGRHDQMKPYLVAAAPAYHEELLGIVREVIE